MPEPGPSAGGRASRSWRRELLLVTVVYLVYRTARIAVTGTHASALRHARQLVRTEKHLGLWWEPRFHRALTSRPVLLHAADLYYGTIHFVVPAVGLALLFRVFPDRYRLWRNVFGWMLALAVILFAVYPVLPPHLLPAGLGFGSNPPPIPAHGPLWSWAAENPYAAVPSLHVGWATWCTVALWRSAPRRLWRVALAVYPVVTFAVVLGTGNHYVLDGVAGLLTLGAACAIEFCRRRSARPSRTHGTAVQSQATTIS